MSGCWLWTAMLAWNGYALLVTRRPDHSRKKSRAHRLAYVALVGPINPVLQLDHKCRVRCCVNPAHLEEVTQQVNIERGDAGAHFAAKTHCPKGHPYSGDNLRIYKSGGRGCHTCHREAANATYLRKRDQRVAS